VRRTVWLGAQANLQSPAGQPARGVEPAQEGGADIPVRAAAADRPEADKNVRAPVGNQATPELVSPDPAAAEASRSVRATATGQPLIATAVQGISKVVPKKAKIAWAQLAATLAQLEEAASTSSAGTLMNLVVEAGYEDYLKAAYENYRSRLEDLEQLGSFSEQFETMEEFLTQLALLTNIEAEETETADRDTERLRLSTIHQAKGLEFEVVFVIMLCHSRRDSWIG